MSTTTTTVTVPAQTEDVELSYLPSSSSTRNEENTYQDESDAHPENTKPSHDWQLYFKLISCGASFFFSGVNDGSLGALLPYVIRSYGLTAAIASTV